MEKLHELMGPGQSVSVLLIIGIVLIWRIAKAVKPDSDRSRRSEAKEINTSPVVEPVAEVVVGCVRDDAKGFTGQAADIPTRWFATADEVPEDSILRRHYLAEQAARREALGQPVPTDSILRRHYEALHQAMVER